MPASLSAVDSLYNNSYGNLYSNPYFLQAYNSPNYNQILQVQQLQQQVAQQQQLQNSGQVGAQVGANNVAFQGAQSAIANESKEKSGSNTTAWVLGIGATAIGIGWWLASRGKARNATGLWNQIKTGFTSLFDKSASVAKSISFQEINGKNVFTLPNKTQALSGAEALAKKDSLGLVLNEGVKWTDDAAKIAGYKFDLKDGGNNIRVTVRNKNGANNFVCTNLSKKVKEEGRTLSSISDDLQKRIEEVITAVSKKDTSAIPTGIELKSLAYGVENGGTSALYFTNPNKGANTSLGKVITNKFLDGSDTVNAVMHDNETFKQAYQNLVAKNKSYDGWTLAEATYNPKNVKNASGTLWPANAALKIEDGKVAGIIENGNTFDLDSDRYKSLHEQFSDVFENAMKNQKDYTNVVRVLA